MVRDVLFWICCGLSGASLFCQRPERLNEQPSVLPAVEVIAPGGSYNPDFFSHQVLFKYPFEVFVCLSWPLCVLSHLKFGRPSFRGHCLVITTRLLD